MAPPLQRVALALAGPLERPYRTVRGPLPSGCLTAVALSFTALNHRTRECDSVVAAHSIVLVALLGSEPLPALSSRERSGSTDQDAFFRSA